MVECASNSWDRVALTSMPGDVVSPDRPAGEGPGNDESVWWSSEQELGVGCVMVSGDEESVVATEGAVVLIRSLAAAESLSSVSDASRDSSLTSSPWR